MTVLKLNYRPGRVNGYHREISLTAYPGTDGISDPLVIPPLAPGARVSVFASPASPSKDTVEVEYSLSSDEDVAAGSATWKSWPGGSVSVDTVDTLLGPVSALRFKAGTSATPSSQGNFQVVV